MGNDRVKSSHIIPEVYIKNFAYTDKIRPQNKESVLVAYRDDFNTWHQKGFGKKSIFTKNGIYDFTVIPEETQTVENQLGVFETKIGNIIPKLKKHEPLEANDYLDLTEFILSLMHRTKEKMNELQFFFKQIHDCFEEFDTSENKEYTKEYFYGYEDFAKLRILDTKKIMNNSKMLYESYYFLYNNSDIPFISSDNPVVSEFLSKNEIEGLFNFPVLNDVSINRKSLILPLTPEIAVLYCDFLDKQKISQNIITLLDSNIVFKMNMLQFSNCTDFVFSNIDNTIVDYAKAYEGLINKDNSKQLIFITEQNKYLIEGSMIKQDIFSATIQINDIPEFESINEKIIQIQDCNNTFGIRATTIQELSRTNENILIEVKAI